MTVDVERAGIRYEVEGHVARITIDRAASMNALDVTANRALQQCWVAIQRDPGVWVAVLQGAGGRAFCAGFDFRASEEEDEELAFGGGLTGVGGPLVRVAVPIVAVVDGWAVGGGFELALACDVIIASEDARFTMPEARLGVMGGAHVVHRLSRVLPRPVAMDLLLTGRIMEAQEAGSRGVVSRVVASESLDEEVEAVIGELLAASPLALAATKRIVDEDAATPLEEALLGEHPAVAEYLASGDAREARAALAEGRTPVWRGR